MRAHQVKVILLTLAFAGSLRASVSTWDVAADFSVTNNPAGAWSYGSKTATDSAFALYPLVEQRYDSDQLVGWSDPALGWIPYVLKNISNDDWFYDGRPAGGIAILPAQEVLLHPNGLSVIRWTAPFSGTFALDVSFQRFEQVDGWTSNYYVVLDNSVLPGGSGTLFGYQLPAAFAEYQNPAMMLNAGDTLDFAVEGGAGAGTILQATISIPEPSVGMLVAAGAFVLLRRMKGFVQPDKGLYRGG